MALHTNTNTTLILFFLACIVCAGYGLPPRIDLGFILDSSTSMGDSDFKLAKQFMADLLDHFSISPGTTRVTVYSVAQNLTENMRFKSYTERDCTLKAVGELKLNNTEKTYEYADSLVIAFKKISAGSKRNNIDRTIVLYLTNDVDDAIENENVLQITGKEMKHATIRSVLVGHDTLKALKKPILSYADPKKDIDSVIDVLGISHKSYSSCTKSGIVYDECNNRCSCKKGKLTNCKRVRREFMTMTTDERRRYLKSYKELTSTQPYKESYEKYVFMHYKYFCWGIHNKDLFLPWHRWYISEMENMLKQIDCRLTLPFWDWSKVSSDPWNRTHIWRGTDDGLGGNGNMYRGYCVQKGIFREGEWETPYWEDPMDIVLSTVDTLHGNITSQRPHLKFCLRRAFKGLAPSVLSIVRTMHLPPSRFSDLDIQIRRNYHDRMHNIIGGTMCTHYAGNTPEFFLHHAMLDNVWYTWQEQSKKHRDAYFTNVRSKSMIGSPYPPSKIVNSHKMPKCIRVTYDKLPTSIRHRRDVDDIDEMARKSYQYFHEAMMKGWMGKFPDCTRLQSENRRARYLHDTLDKP